MKIIEYCKIVFTTVIFIIGILMIIVSVHSPNYFPVDLEIILLFSNRWLCYWLVIGLFGGEGHYNQS